jgi:hypothetical protein
MRLLYCHCAYAQAVPRVVKQDVLRALTDSGVDFEAVADLCEMSARRDPALAGLAAEGDVTIAACYPRAVKWLFSAAGAALPAEGVRILNMRTQTAAEVAAGLLGTDPAAPASNPEPVS